MISILPCAYCSNACIIPRDFCHYCRTTVCTDCVTVLTVEFINNGTVELVKENKACTLCFAQIKAGKVEQYVGN